MLRKLDLAVDGDGVVAGDLRIAPHCGHEPPVDAVGALLVQIDRDHIDDVELNGQQAGLPCR